LCKHVSEDGGFFTSISCGERKQLKCKLGGDQFPAGQNSSNFSKELLRLKPAFAEKAPKEIFREQSGQQSKCKQASEAGMFRKTLRPQRKALICCMRSAENLFFKDSTEL